MKALEFLGFNRLCMCWAPSTDSSTKHAKDKTSMGKFNCSMKRDPKEKLPCL